MRYSMKPPVSLLIALALTSVAGCGTTSSTQLPPQAPVVVKEASILPLSDAQKKQPLPSGAYLKRVEQREEAMEQSLKPLRASSAP